MESAFHSDALDDCRGFFEEPPAIVVEPSTPEVAPTQAEVNASLELLRAQDPATYLALGSLVNAFMKGVSQTAPYQAVPGAAKALRQSLHQTEVL